jgi:hypothetical protein
VGFGVDLSGRRLRSSVADTTGLSLHARVAASDVALTTAVGSLGIFLHSGPGDATDAAIYSQLTLASFDDT